MRWDTTVGRYPEGAAEAVAREAFRRVLEEEPPARWAARYNSHLSMRRRPYQAPLDDDQLQYHADVVDQQLAWNRVRPGMLAAGGRWVNYDADASFVEWISSYDSGSPIGPDWRLAQVLPLKELAPMPEHILRAYFKSSKWQPRTDEEGRLPGVPSHLVAQTCQRLLAYHSARHAAFGQQHVVRLLRLLQAKGGRPEATWEPSWCFEEVVNGPLVVESAAPEIWLQRFVPEARKVIEMASFAMAKPETAWCELKRLLPNRLCVQRACGRCGVQEGARLQAVEAQMPPFGPSCCCSQLRWSSSRVHELLRRIEIWAFDVALRPYAKAPFPVIDFLHLGGEFDWFSSYCEHHDC